MKKCVIFLVLTFLCFSAYSQNFDLIVNTKGDSLACRIDSITDTHIYFEMKYNGVWLTTHESLNYINTYDYGQIDRKKVKFKPGTSYLKPYTASNIANFNNSLYMEMAVFFITSVNYEYRFNTDNNVKTAFSVGMGVEPFDHSLFFSGKLLFMGGGAKNFFESGLVAMYFTEGWWVAGLSVGYRFQGDKGFLFRGPLTFAYLDGEFIPLTAFSVGFSF